MNYRVAGLAVLIIIGCLPAAASGQVGVGPQPMATARPIAAPEDRPFEGTIALAVDATDVRHKIFTVHETIPVQAPGALTLLYPRWEGGSHAATASVADLAGLRIRAGTETIPWRRDPVSVHAFHIDVPDGARTIDVEFQYLTRAADAVLMPDLIAVQWHRMLLYPAGWFARDIAVAATLTLPSGLRPFSSLEVARTEGNVVAFEPTTLETLTRRPTSETSPIN